MPQFIVCKILIIKLSRKVFLEVSVIDHALFLVFTIQGVLLEHSGVEGVDLTDLFLAYCLDWHHSRLLKGLGVNIDLCFPTFQPDVQAAATAEIGQEELPNFGLLDQHKYE